MEDPCFCQQTSLKKGTSKKIGKKMLEIFLHFPKPVNVYFRPCHKAAIVAIWAVLRRNQNLEICAKKLPLIEIYMT